MSLDAYIHRSLPGEPGSPLLFLLHGTGGDENQLIEFGHGLLPGATLVAPRGDVSEGGAARFFRRTGEGVYDMEDLAARTEKMTGFVRAHSQAAKAEPVVGLGYSNGANILASVVFAVPSLFDAAVLMHPLIPFEPQVKGDLSGKRILITAGRRDPISPVALTEGLARYLAAQGANVVTSWHEGGHEIRREELVAAQQFLAADGLADGRN